MVYKLTLIFFWVFFWILLLPQKLYQANINYLWPNLATEGCSMNVFYADYVIGLLFIVELVIIHMLFFSACLAYDFFVNQKNYGFLTMTKGTFVIRFMLISPLIEIVRNGALTFVTLAVFQVGE